MVIRRIRDHVASHDWFAVAIDVVIVLLGVFLGTQMNNWNEGRRAANEIRARPGLRQEMARYVASVDEKLNVLDINIVETRRLARALLRFARALLLAR